MKLLKHIYTLPLLISLFSVALLSGCSQKELPEDTTPTGNTRSFTITVSDSGYQSSKGTPTRSVGSGISTRSTGSDVSTRATENGISTTFTAGDEIGVYAVRNGQILNDIDNLRLTATDDGKGGIEWKVLLGTAPEHYPGDATYYAYYPYQNIFPGDYEPDATATTLEDFFDILIKNWNPAKDQSAYSSYTRQDLMVSQGTVTPATGGGLARLSFAMKHCMALAVIELPRTEYMLILHDDGYTWDYIIDSAPDTKFNNFTPYCMSDGTYRLLVKPSQTDLQLTGSYAKNSTDIAEWTFTANIAHGNYQTYAIDGGKNKTIFADHFLQIGDFFMKDGSLVSKDETLTEQQKADCIGIVFCAGRPDDGSDYSTTGIGQKKCRSYVMALTDVNERSNDLMEWENRASDGMFNQQVGASTSASDWNGYGNTQAIEKYVTDNSADWKMTDFPAATGCLLYGTANSLYDWQRKYTAPAKSSGWLLPSARQLQYLYENSSALSASIQALNRDPDNSHVRWFSTDHYYWSSSECQDHPELSYSVHFDNGIIQEEEKYTPLGVRAILAF